VDTTEIVVLTIFGLLVVAGLVAGIRQSANRRARLRAFAARRGCIVTETDGRLAALLAAALPEEVWRANQIVEVQPAPETAWLFAYNSHLKGRSKTTWHGFACLAEQSRSWLEIPVTIHTRTPGLEILEGGRVKAGGEEFRREFTINCTRPGLAQAAVNAEVEHVLLQHAATPGWYLTVVIAAQAILVSSSWAQKEEEWEMLIALAARLRRAIA
jgi:hypothetical protein